METRMSNSDSAGASRHMYDCVPCVSNGTLTGMYLTIDYKQVESKVYIPRHQIVHSKVSTIYPIHAF